MTVSRVLELIGAGAILAGGFIWVGSINSDVQAHEKRIADVQEQVKKTPTDVAVLQTQVGQIQATIGEVKDKQAKQDEKLDKILEEVRK